MFSLRVGVAAQQLRLSLVRVICGCALQRLSRFRCPWLESSVIFARRVYRAHAAGQPACGRRVGASRLAHQNKSEGWIREV